MVPQKVYFFLYSLRQILTPKTFLNYAPLDSFHLIIEMDWKCSNRGNWNGTGNGSCASEAVHCVLWSCTSSDLVLEKVFLYYLEYLFSSSEPPISDHQPPSNHNELNVMDVMSLENCCVNSTGNSTQGSLMGSQTITEPGFQGFRYTVIQLSRFMGRDMRKVTV